MHLTFEAKNSASSYWTIYAVTKPKAKKISG